MCVLFGKLLGIVFHPRLNPMPAIVKIHPNYVKNLTIILYLLAKERLNLMLNPSFKENSVRPLSLLDDTPRTLFSFQPITSADIDCIIVNMPANKAPGFDKISI